jgi:DNA-binding response OmpR family regulator
MNEGKKKVLIIEDELPMLKALTDALNNSGFDVSTSRNGEEGLEVAMKAAPDAVILDILMPRMDGMTMLKKLRQDTWGKTVPVIILTNVNPESNETLYAVTETEPAYYLIKTETTLDGIIEKVKEVLKTEESIKEI